LGITSGLLMWLAFPPIGFAPAVWIAPIGLVLLVRQQSVAGLVGDAHPTRRPYLALYGAGFLSWLLLMHWLRLPHWAGYFSWPAAALLLASYFPLFVAISRVMVHRWGVSVVVAAPVVWTGLELLRAHVPHGFTMASLGHAHYRWLPLIQIADVAGTYAVSFVVMLAAACLARMIPWDRQRGAWWPAIPLALVVGGTLAYGAWRLDAIAKSDDAAQALRVAIVQGSFDTTFDYDPSHREQVLTSMYEQSVRAVKERADIDLVIWPETMLGWPLFEKSEEFPGVSDSLLAENSQKLLDDLTAAINLNAKAPVAFLLGADIRSLRDSKTEDQYNSALLVSPQGKVLARYDKMNPVWFGETIPLGDVFPWFYKLTPMHGGLRAGARPAAFDVGGVTLCPSVCYESILPHHVRHCVTALRAQGREPQVLVNLTNSGWFHGSSELDLHLICNVFRAVECRKPMLVAANTGFSAHIAPSGKIEQQGPRHEQETLFAAVTPSEMRSLYTQYGDWPAGLCLAACVVAAVNGMAGRVWRRSRRAAAA
jgi:apolipoprotein N-acyltransferase